MSEQEYLAALERILSSDALIYETAVRDIHSLGVYLYRKKYRFLRFAYVALLFGKYPEEIRVTKPPNGVFKVLVAEGWVDHDFISRHTVGFEEAKANVEKQDWDLLERESGTTRQGMRRFAEMLRDARNGIFVWSMGLTQHAHGVETIEALINVGLARGWVGREKAAFDFGRSSASNVFPLTFF